MGDDHTGIILLYGVEHVSVGAGLETVIAVHKRNIAALGHLQRRVASGPWPGILLIDNNNSPVPGSILPAKRQAVILAAVVDQDDFQVLNPLGKDAAKRRGEHMLGIVDRDDDADFHGVIICEAVKFPHKLYALISI